MRDEETGSWWQQVSGEAIQGALKGQKLENVAMDELTFAVWKRENPDGRVLRPDEKIRAANKYESADWESEVGAMPVRIGDKLDSTLEARTLIVGIKINDQAKAYPFSAIQKQKLILDSVGGIEIIVTVAEDGKSVRAFERKVDGKVLEFYVKPDSSEIVDAETGSIWDFSGKATGGELAGKQLKQVSVLKDYWFDWKIYNPQTRLYNLGER
jgi:hypothetical protein